MPPADRSLLDVARLADLARLIAQVAYVPADATPSVATPVMPGIAYMRVANAGPINITQFDDAVPGHIVVLEFSDGNSTITRNNCFLAGGVVANLGADDNLVLIARDNGGGVMSWHELCRSVNA